MWFNPDELKSKITPLANFANPANYEPENSKTEPLISKLAELAEPFNSENNLITCYTPNDDPLEVEAQDFEHAEWLQRMNPKPTF